MDLAASGNGYVPLSSLARLRARVRRFFHSGRSCSAYTQSGTQTDIGSPTDRQGQTARCAKCVMGYHLSQSV